jgi:hypothetical protein
MCSVGIPLLSDNKGGLGVRGFDRFVRRSFLKSSGGVQSINWLLKTSDKKGKKVVRKSTSKAYARLQVARHRCS